MDSFWIQDRFKGRIVAFPNGTSWKIEDKLSERYQTESEPCEATAVYNCSQIASCQAAFQAILKLKMQIIDESQLSPNATERSEFATQKVHFNTDDELYFLRLLADLGCSSSPKLISWSQEKQTNDMWVPEGYVVFMLMEKLPGVMINEREFWEECLLEKRNEVRKAFRDAIIEIQGHRVAHGDEGLRNLLWDEHQQKCYIIDYENCMDFACGKYKDKPLEFHPQLYSLRGLANPFNRDWPRW